MNDKKISLYRNYNRWNEGITLSNNLKKSIVVQRVYNQNNNSAWVYFIKYNDNFITSISQKLLNFQKIRKYLYNIFKPRYECRTYFINENICHLENNDLIILLEKKYSKYLTNISYYHEYLITSN